MASTRKKTKAPKVEGDSTVYRFHCPALLWEALKTITPKTMTMNDALEDAIYKRLGKPSPFASKYENATMKK